MLVNLFSDMILLLCHIFSEKNKQFDIVFLPVKKIHKTIYTTAIILKKTFLGIVAKQSVQKSTLEEVTCNAGAETR